MRLAGVIVQLLVDLALLMRLLLRPKRAVASENLFLRKQLAMYQERGVTSRRPSAADRILLAVLSQWFDWRDALVVGKGSDFFLLFCSIDSPRTVFSFAFKHLLQTIDLSGHATVTRPAPIRQRPRYGNALLSRYLTP